MTPTPDIFVTGFLPDLYVATLQNGPTILQWASLAVLIALVARGKLDSRAKKIVIVVIAMIALAIILAILEKRMLHYNP